MANILIIDDDRMLCEVLSSLIKEMGHNAIYSLTLKNGLREATSGIFDVVFLDVRMPDGNGLEVLPEIRKAPSEPEVIIFTGSGDPDGAELAIKKGAWSYLEKPSSIEKMRLPLVRALQYREERQGETLNVVLKREAIVGNSPLLKSCLDLVAQAANTDANVLITGETGTGKELFARAIHENSSRAEGNFVVVDCTALPESLVESVLFGHKKGAFTGADKTHEGLIKQAHHGTLFLDEIGELPSPMQKAFLRVLQEHCFRPVGGREERRSDFRLISATNRDLDSMTKRGEFREDLMFRLRSFTIELPPLRERKDDIKAIVIYHVSRLCERYQTETKGFSPEFFDSLTSYDWPGNVREIVNALEASIALAGNEPILYSKHLPLHLRVNMVRSSLARDREGNPLQAEKFNCFESIPSWRDYREAMDRKYLQDLISAVQGDIKEAIEISGLSKSRIYALFNKHKIFDMRR
ncbi:MAG: sigma-54 dependent transcriptional regulator [Desulfatiglans sp.]|nr:sigma-54 dependent transcriptional regulator [Thermodesulfobacteriota bacterium]MEE4354480.1 sigma-54 dependent transcriptional regulator [Desulfatiglans sp.]